MNNAIDDAYNAGMHTASDIASPIFDAAGDVIGWIAGALSRVIGAHDAIAVTSPIGHTIGFVFHTETDAIRHVAREGIIPAATYVNERAVDVFDSAGNKIGLLIKNALPWGNIALFVMAGLAVWFILPPLIGAIVGDE